MEWFLVFIGIVIVLGVIAVIVDHRRGTLEDQRKDRYKNPTRPASIVDKASEHPNT